MAKNSTSLRYEVLDSGQENWWIECPDCGFDNQALVLIDGVVHLRGGIQCVACKPDVLNPKQGNLNLKAEVTALIAERAAPVEEAAVEDEAV